MKTLYALPLVAVAFGDVSVREEIVVENAANKMPAFLKIEQDGAGYANTRFSLDFHCDLPLAPMTFIGAVFDDNYDAYIDYSELCVASDFGTKSVLNGNVCWQRQPEGEPPITPDCFDPELPVVVDTHSLAGSEYVFGRGISERDDGKPLTALVKQVCDFDEVPTYREAIFSVVDSMPLRSNDVCTPDQMYHRSAANGMHYPVRGLGFWAKTSSENFEAAKSRRIEWPKETADSPPCFEHNDWKPNDGDHSNQFLACFSNSIRDISTGEIKGRYPAPQDAVFELKCGAASKSIVACKLLTNYIKIPSPTQMCEATKSGTEAGDVAGIACTPDPEAQHTGSGYFIKRMTKI